MLQKIKSQTLYSQVKEQIKEMILSGAVKKGDKLPSENRLIEMIGVSRITVREAIKQLNDEGIVKTYHGKGSFVDIDTEALQQKKYDEEFCAKFLESTRLRIIIEPEVARLAASCATDEDIKKIEKALSSGKNNDSLENFHLSIINCLENETLTEVFSMLTEREQSLDFFEIIPREELGGVLNELDRQHVKIFEAIKRHDPEFAYFYMKEHASFVYKSYQEYFTIFSQNRNNGN